MDPRPHGDRARPIAARSVLVVTGVLGAGSVAAWWAAAPPWHPWMLYSLVDLTVGAIYGVVAWLTLSRRAHPAAWIMAAAGTGGAVSAAAAAWDMVRYRWPDLDLAVPLAGAAYRAWIPGFYALIVVLPWLLPVRPLGAATRLTIGLGVVRVGGIAASLRLAEVRIVLVGEPGHRSPTSIALTNGNRAVGTLHAGPRPGEKLDGRACTALEVDRQAARVREIARDLLPPLLDDGDLGPALDRLRERYAAAGLTVRVRAPHLRLREEAAIAVYGIVAEAVPNIHRHAGVDRCSIDVRAVPKGLTVSVADHGVGIGAGAGMGVGTQAMRERGEAIGADLTIGPARTGNPRPGTRVRLFLTEAAR